MADQMKMQILSIVGAVCAVAFSIAAVFAVLNAPAVAATVNGAPIYEADITKSIQLQREQAGLSDSETWKQALSASSTTPEQVREQAISTRAQQMIIVQGAKALGATASDDVVDAYIAQQREQFTDDAAWNSALEMAGYTTSSYRELVKAEESATSYFEQNTQVSDEEMAQYVKYYASLLDGGKRSSHILITVASSATDEEKQAARAKAEEALAQINSGAMSFEDAVTKYSGDTQSAANGGDIGWDRAQSLVTAYSDALSGLTVGQMTGIVETEYGYHIIKCTEEYKAPENASTIDQLPSDVQEDVKKAIQSAAAQSALSMWAQSLIAKADISINPMPSDLPYNVDMNS